MLRRHINCCNYYYYAFVGVFFLLIAYSAITYIQSHLTKAEFRHFFFLAIMSSAGLVFLAVVGLTYAGNFVILSTDI